MELGHPESAWGESHRHLVMKYWSKSDLSNYYNHFVMKNISPMTFECPWTDIVSYCWLLDRPLCCTGTACYYVVGASKKYTCGQKGTRTLSSGHTENLLRTLSTKTKQWICKKTEKCLGQVRPRGSQTHLAEALFHFNANSLLGFIWKCMHFAPCIGIEILVGSEKFDSYLKKLILCRN